MHISIYHNNLEKKQHRCEKGRLQIEEQVEFPELKKKAEKQVQAKFCRDRRRNQEYIRSIRGGEIKKSMNTEEYIAECQISSVAL